MKRKCLALFILPLLCLLCVPGLLRADEQADTNESEADRLFMEALQSLFPLGPQEIGKVREQQQQVEEAITRTPIARILSESRPMLLEPGKVSPPVILTPGYVGACVFFDSTGAPWPISRAVIGNESLFSLIANENDPSSIQGDSHVLYVCIGLRFFGHILSIMQPPSGGAFVEP